MSPRENEDSNEKITKYNSKINTTVSESRECDYLVVGAGNLGLSFTDTMITQNPSATFVIVDRNTKPGGHWTHAYPFVRLHQPSCTYGVNSLSLGKNLNSKGHEKLDQDDRATATEIVEYYERVCDRFKATGRVECFFGAEYEFDDKTREHTVRRRKNSDGDARDVERYVIKCGKMVVVHTDVTVPSARAPLVPVHSRVHFVPVNEIESSVQSGKYKNYVVFGNGKTGTDAIVHLMEKYGIDQSQITWIVSRDVWYWLRDAMKDVWHFLDIVKRGVLTANSAKECFRLLEKDGLFARLDPTRPDPKIFKGPLIDRKELDILRTIERVVRLGRATSVEENKIVMEKGSVDFSSEDTLLVDCMSDKWIGGIYPDDFKIFHSGQINLLPSLVHFNGSATAAIIAFLECSFNDDVSKNSCCYFPRGPYCQPTPENSFLGGLYFQNKTYDALLKLPGGTKFLMNSRTNFMNPNHHKGGLLRLLWAFYGPQQLAAFDKKLREKVESKGFSDIDHCFGLKAFQKEIPPSETCCQEKLVGKKLHVIVVLVLFSVLLCGLCSFPSIADAILVSTRYSITLKNGEL